MTRFKFIMWLLFTAIAMTATAQSFETLTFVMTDGTMRAFSTDELVITYDDFAHAVVTNSETTATIDLVDVDYMCFGDVEDTALKGDVNGDGEVNIADVNAAIGVVLGRTTDAATQARADVNNDGEVNIADINAVIAIILAQ